MNSRDRIKLALQHREPDRVPIHDSPWAATVDRWRTEGLPSGVSPSDYFGYDMASYTADTSPQFPSEVLSENDDFIVERNSFGMILKNHRDYSTTPMVIDYPCKKRDDWEKAEEARKAKDSVSDKRILEI